MTTNWIKEGLKRCGKSQRDLAAHLGLAPSAVSRLLGGKRELKAKEIEVIAKFLAPAGEGIPSSLVPDAARNRDYAKAGHYQSPDFDPASVAIPGTTPMDGAAGDFAPAELHRLPANSSLQRDLPVMGAAVGGADGAFTYNGQVVDFIRRPPGMAEIKQSFALYVTGSSMEPRYEEGDLVIVHPGRPPRPGCDVIVELYGSNGEPGHCFLKRFVRRTAEGLLLRQFNPNEDFVLAKEKIKTLYRVVSTSELLGV